MIAALRPRTPFRPDHGRDVAGGVWVVPGPGRASSPGRLVERRRWPGCGRRSGGWSMPAVSTCRVRCCRSGGVVVDGVVTGSASEDLVQVRLRWPGCTTAAPGSGCWWWEGSALDRGVGEFFGAGRVWCAGRCDDLVRMAGAVLTSGRAVARGCGAPRSTSPPMSPLELFSRYRSMGRPTDIAVTRRWRHGRNRGSAGRFGVGGAVDPGGAGRVGGGGDGTGADG